MIEPLPFLRLPRTHRGIITGQTGTGKSTLARLIVQQHREALNSVIIDPKLQFDPVGMRAKRTGYRIVTDPAKLSGITKQNILYRPGGEYNNPEDYDRVFRWIYDRKNTFVYIDELSALIGRSFQSYPPWLRQLYQQGRGLGITILAATQRPSGFPRFVFSESDQFWKFFLLLEDDQKTMAEYMGRTVLEPRDYPNHTAHHDKHSFFYRDLTMQAPAAEHLLEFRK